MPHLLLLDQLLSKWREMAPREDYQEVLDFY